MPLLSLWLSMAPTAVAATYTPQDGDIILHTSTSTQSKLIQVVTRSPYSHVGIVYIQKGTPMVFEASSTVRLTPLAAWVARGVDNQYRVLRTTKPLTAAQLQSMQTVGEAFSGKAYDTPFRWSDDTMYCSELVWKIYARGAGITLVEPQLMQDYSGLTAEAEAEMKRRWGSEDFRKELVVAPSDLLDSPSLQTVYDSQATP